MRELQIRESDLGGSAGILRVSNTTLVSGGDVRITTGRVGRTTVRDSTVVAPGAVAVASGPAGVCRVLSTSGAACT